MSRRIAAALLLLASAGPPLLAAGTPPPAPAPAPPSIRGVPPPPSGVFEAEITAAVVRRLQAETAAMLANLDTDRSISEADRKEIRRKASRLKVAVFTTPAKLEDVATFYEQKVKEAAFVFAERPLLLDALETAQAGGFALDAAVTKSWEGKTGKSARWSRQDRGLEIDVEDHLIDPRDGSIAKKTVVLLTAVD